MHPTELTIDNYQEMVQLFHTESDRGAAVLAGSYLENFLGVFLKKAMTDQSLSEKIFGANGPLSTFSQRIDFAQAFGLLPKSSCDELHLIRKIRNHFAHCPKNASFDIDPVRDWANKLLATANRGDLLSGGNKFQINELKLAYLLVAGMLVVTMAHLSSAHGKSVG